MIVVVEMQGRSRKGDRDFKMECGLRIGEDDRRADLTRDKRELHIAELKQLEEVLSTPSFSIALSIDLVRCGALSVGSLERIESNARDGTESHHAGVKRNNHHKWIDAGR
jgi:hypothetical protein